MSNKKQTQAFTKAFLEELRKSGGDEEKMAAATTGLVNIFRRLVSKNPDVISKAVRKMREGANFLGKHGV